MQMNLECSALSSVPLLMYRRQIFRLESRKP
jgi:hypothetical protein